MAKRRRSWTWNCLLCDTVLSRRRKPPPGEKAHRARGLCNSCWYSERKAGRLEEWRGIREVARERVVTEIDELVLRGIPPEKWGDEVDMTLPALSKLLYRAQRPELGRVLSRIMWKQRKERG